MLPTSESIVCIVFTRISRQSAEALDVTSKKLVRDYTYVQIAVVVDFLHSRQNPSDGFEKRFSTQTQMRSFRVLYKSEKTRSICEQAERSCRIAKHTRQSKILTERCQTCGARGSIARACIPTVMKYRAREIVIAPA